VFYNSLLHKASYNNSTFLCILDCTE